MSTVKLNTYKEAFTMLTFFIFYLTNCAIPWHFYQKYGTKSGIKALTINSVIVLVVAFIVWVFVANIMDNMYSTGKLKRKDKDSDSDKIDTLIARNMFYVFMAVIALCIGFVLVPNEMMTVGEFFSKIKYLFFFEDFVTFCRACSSEEPFGTALLKAFAEQLVFTFVGAYFIVAGAIIGLGVFAGVVVSTFAGIFAIPWPILVVGFCVLESKDS